MHPLIYDVAVSIDGFISGPGGDISRFAHEGLVVEDYAARLASYAVAVMGRATYEFGYGFGLKPGENPYPHMRTLVFSRSIELPPDSRVETVRAGAGRAVAELKATAEGPVYLVGGGAFAASLLSAGLIDRVRLKRAPVLLGGGVRVFGEDAASSATFECLRTRSHDDGYVFQEFAVRNGA